MFNNSTNINKTNNLQVAKLNRLFLIYLPQLLLNKLSIYRSTRQLLFDG
jgi:hypothetical protein